MGQTLNKEFICVFNEYDREKLIQAGFVILRDDTRNKIFIFINDTNKKFAIMDMAYAYTDTLTF